MSSSEMPSIKSPNVLRIAALILSFTAILMVFVLWPSSEKNKPNTVSLDKKPPKARETALTPRRESTTQAPEPQASPVRPKPRPETPTRVAPDRTYPAIGELLTNDQLSHDETARQLAKIALDPKAPEAERLEAMEHGKNLGFSHLLPLSLDPNLPLPLAESYLHGLHGHDQTKEQVSGALGLLNHSDPDIRQQAQILLGFLLEAEEDNESPDKLREKADAFLKQPDEEDGAMDIEH